MTSVEYTVLKNEKNRHWTEAGKSGLASKPKDCKPSLERIDLSSDGGRKGKKGSLYLAKATVSESLVAKSCIKETNSSHRMRVVCEVQSHKRAHDGKAPMLRHQL